MKAKVAAFVLAVIAITGCASNSVKEMASGTARIEVIKENYKAYTSTVSTVYMSNSRRGSMYTMAEVLEIRNEETNDVVFKQGNLVSQLFQDKTVDIPAGTYMVTHTCYKKVDGSSRVGKRNRQTSRVVAKSGAMIYLYAPSPYSVNFRGDNCINQFQIQG